MALCGGFIFFIFASFQCALCTVRYSVTNVGKLYSVILLVTDRPKDGSQLIRH